MKLGTITKEGTGDVYSYEEDAMVEDPYLIEHLAHFGINIANMVKVSVLAFLVSVRLNVPFTCHL